MRLGRAAATAEGKRLLEEHHGDPRWKRWGMYLSDRQWGTVREDYSPDGEAWSYFSHDMARSRAYRWGEDGLLGLCDWKGRLNFALALWNGRDPFLKERLFGLTGPQGNHGEDVKECYFHVDATPTASFARALYKYPQGRFPYEQLVEENARRDKSVREGELEDTGAFDHGRFFDIEVTYAKAGDEDIAIRVVARNRGPEEAPLHVLPTLWYRNTWSWGPVHEGVGRRPRIAPLGKDGVRGEHESFGAHVLRAEGDGEWLFTENETNNELLFGSANASPFVKDAFHRYVVEADREAVNPARAGSKAAMHHKLLIPAGGSATLRLRFSREGLGPAEGEVLGVDDVIALREAEADEFYGVILERIQDPQERLVARQAWAGLVWTKQYYRYQVDEWLDGDPMTVRPPASRLQGRNSEWRHLNNSDVISMPDKWEYPWYAAWDLAFHMIPMARIDPCFAKKQLDLLTREWYMHPNGQLPAYEFALGDVNPPVHAWATWRVYKMTGEPGARDRLFLERVFHKLLMNFTWWVNRKDPEGRNVFGGGFLGLDNIGVFDRSKPLPFGATLEQADGTAWMAFYAGCMLSMALELAQDNPAYEDIATKFFEHFVAIARAMNTVGGSGLWDDKEGFFHDRIVLGDKGIPLRVKSMVGLVPLLAVEVLDERMLERVPGFRKRMEWFLRHSGGLDKQMGCLDASCGHGGRQLRLLSIYSRERLERTLQRMLDEAQFLSPHGIRSLSREHLDAPFQLHDWTTGKVHEVRYAPGESDSHLFGGNSNWRGPVWFPLNYLLVEALERYDLFYGERLTVEMPTGSGNCVTLGEVARELSRRLASLFLPGKDGARPALAESGIHRIDPEANELLHFHEYFDGETGRGCGASHQTGWTALVAELLRRLATPDAQRASMLLVKRWQGGEPGTGSAG